jgi:glucose-1-phosphate thymidylyltransferase
MPRKNKNPNTLYDLVGVIPAAGTGSRLGLLPCSKELMPVGFHEKEPSGRSQPKVVSHYLLEKMHQVDVSKVYMIIREGKWDIPAYFGDGRMLDLNIAYLMMNLPFGVPFTIDQAYPFIRNSIVLFGFPDILFEPGESFSGLLEKQEKTQADVVLGLFPCSQPYTADMVDFDNEGIIRNIEVKPTSTDLRYAWIIAVWTSKFTQFMHDFLRSTTEKLNFEDEDHGKELFLGDVFQAAKYSGLLLQTVIFRNGRYFDFGTSDDLKRAIKRPLF